MSMSGKEGCKKKRGVRIDTPELDKRQTQKFTTIFNNLIDIWTLDVGWDAAGGGERGNGEA